MAKPIEDPRLIRVTALCLALPEGSPRVSLQPEARPHSLGHTR